MTRRASREHYQRAVDTAKAAIEQVRRPPCTGRHRPSAQAAIADVRAKAERGEPVSPEELGAIAAALESQGTARRPKRGRPRGAGRATHEKRAVRAALMALEGSPLHLYRTAPGGGAPTRCDAVAEAMRACGFRRLCTYGAVAIEARKYRRREKAAARLMAHLNASLAPARSIVTAVERQIAEATAPARRAQARASAIVRAVEEPARRIRRIAENRFPPDI